MTDRVYNTIEDVVRAFSQHPPGNIVIFSDLDGSILDFHVDPEAVTLFGATHHAISKINSLTNNGFIPVTGRDSAFVDRIFEGMQLAGAFESGVSIRRFFNGEVHKVAPRIDLKKIDDLFAGHTLPEGFEIEHKPSTRALHWIKSTLPYGQALTAARVIANAVVENYNEQSPSNAPIKAELGSNVLEIGSIQATKGKAVSYLLENKLYHGRTAFFIGDTLADKSGMDVVKGHNGITIGIGAEAPENADFYLHGPKEMRHVLFEVAKCAEWNKKDAIKLAP